MLGLKDCAHSLVGGPLLKVATPHHHHDMGVLINYFTFREYLAVKKDASAWLCR